MKNFTASLGFRLTAASYLVVTVFMAIAGYTVYRVSKDSIQQGAMTMIQNMAEDLAPALAQKKPAGELGDVLLRRKSLRSGSVWIMDKDGALLYNPDPLFRDEYIAQRKNFGNVVVSLQAAKPYADQAARPRQGGFREKLVDVIGKYEEGFGTYKQFGKDRIVAFRSFPAQGLLVAVDEPVSSANSELDRIKTYISYTGLVSALMIMAFNLLAIRIIIRPYYRELEDLNASLQHSNAQLEDLNGRLTLSNRNLTVLYEVGLGMRHSLQLRDILALIVKGAHGVLGVDRIAVFVPAADGSSLELRAAAGAGDAGPVRVPLGVPGGALAAAFSRKEVVRVDEGQRIPASLRLAPPLAAVPLLRSRAFVVVPLVVKDRAVGVIAVDNKSGRGPVTEEQVNLLGIFANQAAVAVDNARLYEQLRQKIAELDARVDQLSIMHQIGNSMQRVVTRDEALGFIMRGIFEGIGFTEVVLTLVNREEDTLQGETGLGVDAAAVGALRVPLIEEENLLVMAAARKAPVGIVHEREGTLLPVLGAPLAEGAYRESVGTRVEGARLAVMAVPLIAREEVIGVIAVARREPPVVKRSEVELLLLYANTAGLTVERAELYGKLHQNLESLEITDGVSRLFTHQYGQQRVHEELAKAAAAHRPFAALMVGVDRFKEYNDRCGHEAGDRALAEIGEILKAALRHADIAFRYGGRILAAGLPDTDRAAALAVAEQVVARLRRHRFAGPAGERDQALTASVGLACYGAEDRVAEADLFRALLGSLHRAEAGGGDRVFETGTNGASAS